MKDIRVLVCGSRDYVAKEALFKTLDHYHRQHNIKCVIEGGTNGADRMAKEWAQANDICVMEFPANWGHGKSAGPVRNNRMLKYGQPELVIAFPTKNSKGTWHMVKRAEEAGLPLAVFEEDKLA